ncbi:Alpha/Beta hydrolase protein [Phlyctochytrium arcticum]|nr:Alpha/Beta hydrolase protein [Phlyctochytrium arcticum]
MSRLEEGMTTNGDKRKDNGDEGSTKRKATTPPTTLKGNCRRKMDISGLCASASPPTRTISTTASGLKEYPHISVHSPLYALFSPSPTPTSTTTTTTTTTATSATPMAQHPIHFKSEKSSSPDLSPQQQQQSHPFSKLEIIIDEFQPLRRQNQPEAKPPVTKAEPREPLESPQEPKRYRRRSSLSLVPPQGMSRPLLQGKNVRYSGDNREATRVNPLHVPVTEITLTVPSGMTLAAKVWGDASLVRRGETEGSSKSPADGPSSALVGLDSRKCILALHGWLDNAGSFDLLAPKLITSHSAACIVCIDLPGHGLSSHRSPHGGGYYVWDMVDDVLGALDDLQWPACTLLGHSTGGHIAAFLASSFPSRVSRLVLLESLGTAVQFKASEPQEMANFITRRREINTWAKATRVYDSFEDAARARTRGFTPLSLEAARLLCDRGLQPVFPNSSSPSPTPTSSSDQPSGIIDGEIRHVWRTDPHLTLWAYLHCSEPTLLTYFSALACPTLIILAESSGLFSLKSTKLQTRLRAIRNATCRVVPGGHHHHLESEHVDGVVGGLHSWLVAA